MTQLDLVGEVAPAERAKKLRRAFCQYAGLMLVVVAAYFVLYFHRVTTIPVHEAFGLLIVVVVAIHIWFFRGLFSFIGSQCAPVFLWRDFVLLLLALSFVATVISGIAISHYFFRGWFEVDKRFWRTMHTMASTSMLVVVGLHIGCYWSRFVMWFQAAWSNAGTTREQRDRNGKWARFALQLTFYVLALNGFRIMTLGEDFWYIITWQQFFGFYDSDRLFYWNLTDDVSMVLAGTFISHYVSKGLCQLSLKKS